MGRGARPVRRWKNDRIRAKKARGLRKIESDRATAGERHAATTAVAGGAPAGSGSGTASSGPPPAPASAATAGASVSTRT